MTEELREGLLDPANQMLVWIRLSRKHPVCWTRQLVLACWCCPRVFCFFLTRGNSCLHGRACCLPHWQKCLSCMLQLWCVFPARPQNSKHTFLACSLQPRRVGYDFLSGWASHLTSTFEAVVKGRVLHSFMQSQSIKESALDVK